MSENLTEIFTSVALLVSAITLLIMIWQNRIARQASRSQNILSVIDYLMKDEVRKARHHVITRLRRKSLSKWTKRDTWNADAVCASYAAVAGLMRRRYVEIGIFTDDWGPSIKRNYQILKKHIKTRQTDAGSRYWDDFDWLYEQVVRWERKHNIKEK